MKSTFVIAAILLSLSACNAAEYAAVKVSPENETVMSPNCSLRPTLPYKYENILVYAITDSDMHIPSKTQAASPDTSRPKGMWAGNATKFFQGAFTGFAGHEFGHVIANYSLGTDPYLKSVNYGPIPFFTIEPGRPLSQREHYITASAGFNAQNIINEWVLTKHPNLSAEDEPYLKGITTFNFWLSVGYAASALTKTGPSERDTKGMADALGWDERWVGMIILVPTALDTYRYKHPDAEWAVTASRLSKLAMIFLALDTP